MANSYPRRDQARGIWKINDITKNIKDQGTYPQAGGAGKGFTAGGYGSNTIDVVTIKTTGNATDFGDLISSGSNGTSCRGNATRIIFVGGDSPSNLIQYITPTSTGNSSDYGDLTAARFMIGGGSNTTRAVNMGGQSPAKGNVIDFMKYKTARDEVLTEFIKDDIMNFLLNAESYEPDTFTFTLTVEDNDD